LDLETLASTARRHRKKRSKDPPPPWDEPVLEPDVEGVTKTTEVLAVAAGGAPAHVIEYVTAPAPDSVTVMVPASPRVPVHPSPEFPPEAAQESALVELHLSETLCPVVSVESLLVSVTAGVATVTVVAETGR
jgi:hypothetical protein